MRLFDALIILSFAAASFYFGYNCGHSDQMANGYGKRIAEISSGSACVANYNSEAKVSTR